MTPVGEKATKQREDGGEEGRGGDAGRKYYGKNMTRS